MSEARVEMYTTQYCGYCINAKRVLQRDGIDFVDHDVGRDRSLRQKIAGETGWRTVPMIFVDGKFVGGYTEMMAFRSRGGFDEKPA
ncbi:MAG: glutaredoxin 3 [Myxococcota bacterium]|jgi:glutaredoxin 3